MADFKGKTTKDVEILATIRDGQFVHGEDGQVKGAYVSCQVNQSHMTKAQAAAGECQTNTNLVSKEGKPDKDGNTMVNHSVYMTKSQIDTMQAASGDKTLKKDDVTVMAFKADLIKAQENVKDADGKNTKDSKGEDIKRTVGFMPNTKTVKESEFGAVTDKTMTMQYNRTMEAREAAANIKSAKLSAAVDTKEPQAASEDKVPEMA